MTQFRRRLLHCINLSRPHTRKVIFYRVCQSLINPCTSSILLRERKRWGGLEKQKHLTILFFSRSLSLFLISIPACHKLASFFSHRTLTPIAFSFFFFAPHGGTTIFLRGAHFSQTVMNGSGSCIDFQTETI